MSQFTCMLQLSEANLACRIALVAHVLSQIELTSL